MASISQLQDFHRLPPHLFTPPPPPMMFLLLHVLFFVLQNLKVEFSVDVIYLSENCKKK